MSDPPRMEGLAAIVGSLNPDTFHEIDAPPEMSDPPTEAEQKAYDEWWVRTHTWKMWTRKVEPE